MAGYTAVTLSRAKTLRRAATDAERALWRMLRAGQVGGAKFRRQQPIGPYIADFACQSARLIIEVDGGQHVESMHDEVRTQFLNARGYRVLRFWNYDVLNRAVGVHDEIVRALRAPHPPTATQWAPPSPLKGERIGDYLA